MIGLIQRFADPKEAWKGGDCRIQNWNHVELEVAIAIVIAIAIARDYMASITFNKFDDKNWVIIL